MTNSSKSKLTRDVLLVSIGVFLSMAFQGLNDLLEATYYPSLFFPKGASLGAYETSELELFLGGIILAVLLVWIVTRRE